MKLLDLFCGAGGAAMGYSRAGFDDITGVDIKPQPHYPFKFIQADAMTFDLSGYDAIHASPPCQFVSKAVKKVNRTKRTNLIPPVRERLRLSRVPYVIENVKPEVLESAIRLCGSYFGLPIQRHRYFESSLFLQGVQCSHTEYPRKYPPAWNRTTNLRVLSISGGYQTRKDIGEDFLSQHKQAMGIDWEISYNELSEAIPPVYTEFIGVQIIERRLK